MQIQVVMAGSVNRGEYITQADSDDYKLGEFVPAEDYEPSEQDWQHVIDFGGHADIGWMLLAYYNGERYKVRGDWSQTVWRYLDDDGKPVFDEPADVV
jgi:hypothetical protein